ncbi:MAG: ACT domain-containing protein [Eubacterium sp.]|nr:ACT domain-containing protein [Eubacterium sp.]
MSVKQISIFVENRPGAMHEMTNVLADNKIDMRALSLAETEGFGIVRIIVDDAYEATTVLKEAGYINKLTPVVIVAIPDETGGLNQVLQIFTDNQINVEYMYAILGGKRVNEAYMIFRVDDDKKAESALRAKGIRLVQQDEIETL